MSENLGDINSTARGTGARYNSGKTAVDLIPLWIPAATHAVILSKPLQQAKAIDWQYNYPEMREMLALLSEFQMRKAGPEAILGILAILGMSVWKDCADVFDYGRKKYAEWNWAKGLPWMSVVGCAGRHLLFGMLRGEELDAESGLPHRGHLACNLVMLLTFIDTYPEGDDRPPAEYFGGAARQTGNMVEFAETQLATR